MIKELRAFAPVGGAAPALRGAGRAARRRGGGGGGGGVGRQGRDGVGALLL